MGVVEYYRYKIELFGYVEIGVFSSFFVSEYSATLLGGHYLLPWLIWQWRNRIVHAQESDKVKVKEEDIFPSFQRDFAIWISARSSNNITDLQSWYISSFKDLEIAGNPTFHN